MPHVEIKYSANLDIDFDALFLAIENVVQRHDESAGICKSRAYPCVTYRHTHILITISMLSKAHRDQAFTQKLSNALEKEIKQHISQACNFSFVLEYSPPQYITNFHSG